MAEYDPTVEQPKPVQHADGPDVQTLVIQDIAARRIVGIQRYGTALRPFNGRDAKRDAYDEVLDLAAYFRQMLEEEDHASELLMKAASALLHVAGWVSPTVMPPAVPGQPWFDTVSAIADLFDDNRLRRELQRVKEAQHG